MGLQGGFVKPFIVVKRMLNVHCPFASKDLSEWCEHIWDQKIRGELVLKKKTIICHSCICFVDEDMVDSTDHPDATCQPIEEFCHQNNVTTGDTLFKAIRDLTLKVAGSRSAVWFPSLNMNHLGRPAIKDKSRY